MHVIEVAVVVMVLVILFIIYRNLFTMMMPLITIGITIAVAQAGEVAALAEVGLPDRSAQTIILMTTMMFGAGTDYAVFLFSRYHDYLRQGLTSDEAVAYALDDYR